MKKLTSLFLSTALIMSVVLTSCGKYEDGPGFTVRSKKARLCQTWKPVKYIDGQTGTEVNAGANDGTFTFDKDGKFTLSQGSTSTEGTWEWANDKEAVTVKFVILGITTSETSTITRLTMSELWMKDTDGDVTQLSAQ